jgi:hypothetical protein
MDDIPQTIDILVTRVIDDIPQTIDILVTEVMDDIPQTIDILVTEVMEEFLCSYNSNHHKYLKQKIKFEAILVSLIELIISKVGTESFNRLIFYKGYQDPLLCQQYNNCDDWSSRNKEILPSPR